LVAARPLAMGARLSAGDVKVVPWPSRTPLAGAHAKAAEVVDRGVIAPLLENEPVTEAKLAPREAGAGLAPTIPPGMRAISVRVNEVIGVAGFAGQGAHVDVLATVRKPGGAVSRLLVSNVPVLMTGTRAEQQQGRDEKPSVVTLMVTPAQAERIALASAEGNITLMLRNPLVQTQADTPG